MKNLFTELKEKLQAYHRVLIVARKPTWEEFRVVAKVTGVGMLLIGTLGFIIYIISVLLGA